MIGYKKGSYCEFKASVFNPEAYLFRLCTPIEKWKQNIINGTRKTHLFSPWQYSDLELERLKSPVDLTALTVFLKWIVF